ncbi:MAG: C4-dicarboxylate TRAP transporter substrate-binding protein [Desulfobacterales bacterium]|nr:MAG: C4-dicarboxylate TRAP transporter substrate-binding protein [Desulfobacterales bacterium]
MKGIKIRTVLMMVSVIIWVIAGSALVGLSTVAAKGKVHIVIHDPAMSRGYTKAWEWWAQEVEKETKGEVTFEILWGGPLGGFREALDNVSNGVFDMAMIIPTYSPSKLPLWTAFEVPFLSNSMWAFGRALWDMKDIPVLKKEIEQWNMKVMIPIMPTSFEIMSRNPVKNLADLKGLKIRAYGMFAEVLGHFEAQSVSIAANEIYENMQRGVVDAAILPWPDFFVNYGVYELSQSALVLGGFGYIVAPLCINMDTWNKISPENQEIMTKLARQAVDKNVEISNSLAEPALAKIKAKGIEINYLSKDERDQMVQVAAKIWDRWVEKQTAEGRPDARMVMDTMIEKVKEYEKQDPFKK